MADRVSWSPAYCVRVLSLADRVRHRCDTPVLRGCGSLLNTSCFEELFQASFGSDLPPHSLFTVSIQLSIEELFLSPIIAELLVVYEASVRRR